jgi:hypothetical protein
MRGSQGVGSGAGRGVRDLRDRGVVFRLSHFPVVSQDRITSNPNPASQSALESTDHRNVPPSTRRDCGCGAASGDGQDGGGGLGPRLAS